MVDAINDEPCVGTTSSGSGVSEAGRSDNEHSQQQGALEVSFTFASSRRRSSKSGCIVQACSTPLSSKYELRYRLCTVHMKAPQFLIGGDLHRWCQKCGKFHPLSEFDGTRKSCRAALERHNDKQKKLRLRKQAAAAAAAAAEPTPCPSSAAMDCVPVEVPVVADSRTASEASASPPPLQPPSFYTVEVAEVYPQSRLSPAFASTPFNGPEGIWNDALAAAFPPLPPAVMCDESAAEPQELDDFIAEMLLEPSVTLEGLNGGSMDPAAFLDSMPLPAVMDLPLLV